MLALAGHSVDPVTDGAPGSSATRQDTHGDHEHSPEFDSQVLFEIMQICLRGNFSPSDGFGKSFGGSCCVLGREPSLVAQLTREFQSITWNSGHSAARQR